MPGNAFSCLKRYVSEVDLAENHATESLAACLRVSAACRREFIEFLAPKGKSPFLSHPENYELETQYVCEAGIMDIVLSNQHQFVCIEVKIGSPEDEAQLLKYAGYLRQQPKPLFFLLVRSPRKSLDLTKMGLAGRRTWQELWGHLNSCKNKYTGTDRALIEHLCDYLAEQGIAFQISVAGLLAYRSIEDRQPVQAFFNCLADRLSSHFEFSNPKFASGKWPQMRIGNQFWKKLFWFGDAKRLSLWLTVPGIWDATDYGFDLELEVWHQGYDSYWPKMKTRIYNWFRILKENRIPWEVFEKDWMHARSNLDMISNTPKRIKANLGTVMLMRNGKPRRFDEIIDDLTEQIEKANSLIFLLPPSL